MNDKTKETTTTNPAPGPQSTKPVAPSATAVKDPDEAPRSPTPDGTSDVSAEEQRRIDAMLGDDPEDSDNLERPAYTAQDANAAKQAVKKLFKLVEGTKHAPDSHSVWGAAGVSLTLGDLRALIKGVNYQQIED